MEHQYKLILTKNECDFLTQALDALVRNQGLKQAANCFALANKIRLAMQPQEVHPDE